MYLIAVPVLLVVIHSWYPSECCSDKDCEPIQSERVMETAAGFIVDGSKFVQHIDTRPSPDGGYHACRYAHPAPLLPKPFRCFFVPPKGV